MSKTQYRALLFAGAALAVPVAAMAQAPAPEHQSRSDVLLDDVIVTAQKKTAGERTQDVPLAVTAFGSKQIEAMELHDVTDISGKIPGVSLQSIGTFKGTASFAIRGLGQTSSVSSLDSVVGTFVDGVYLGTNAAVITDTFDLDSIEVLRGPQGTLFGRNVVGGAVLINTKRPTRDWTGNFKASVESGLRGTGAQYTGAGVVSGPISDTLSFKAGLYYSKDNGWFENTLDGRNSGRDRTVLGRVALLWEPTDNFNTLLRYEHGDSHGDPPIAQSHPKPSNGSTVAPTLINGVLVVNNHSRYSHGFTANVVGYDYQKWDFAVLESNLETGFGDGKFTNIFGYREWQRDTRTEGDASANTNLEGFTGGWQRQFSDELRYAGRFGPVDVTSGLFAFHQEVQAREQLDVFGGAANSIGAGKQKQYSLAIFANADWHVSDRLTVSGGLRYSYEHKSVAIGANNTNALSPPLSVAGVPNPNPVPTDYCTVGQVPNRDPVYDGQPECFYDFHDSADSNTVSFKVGGLYELADNVRVYANWARAFRAGGYNFRNPSFLVRPGPIRDEQVDNWEVGLKAEPLPRARIAVTGFYSKIKDAQRVTTVLEDPRIPVVTKVINAGDGEISGVELEGQAEVLRGLVLQANLALMTAQYTKVDPVFGDLNGDRRIDGADKALDFPKYSPVTYFVGATYSRPVGDGEVSASVSYSHADRQFAADNNIGFINPVKNIDASLTYVHDGLEFSVYGKNLANKTQNQSDSEIGVFGSVSAIIAKGRIFGLSMRYNY